MTEIAIQEAKTHLSNLLKRVENGECFTITNRGRMVAVVIPSPNNTKKNAKEAYSKLLELINEHPNEF